MRHFTEQNLKDALDGTFTCFDAVTGAVKTRQVDHDYRPSHSIIGSRGSTCAGVKRENYRPFTPSDDEMIIALKAKGISARRIGVLLQRGDDAGINRRYQRLVRQGKCQAVVS